MSGKSDKDDDRTLPVWAGNGKHAEYERWETLVRIKCAAKDIAEALKRKITSGDSAELKLKNSKAMDIILSHTKGTAFKMVKRLDSAFEIMEKLTDRYGVAVQDDENLEDLFAEWTKLCTMTGDPYMNPNNWMEMLSNCAGDLETIDNAYKRSETEIKAALVYGLPDIYDSKGILRDLVKDIKDNAVDVEKMKKNIHHAWKKNFKGKKRTTPTTLAYAAKSTLTCKHCGKQGHTEEFCWEKNPELKKKRAESRTCFHCGKKGHIKADCPKLKKEQEEKKDNSETVPFVEATRVSGSFQSSGYLFLPDEPRLDGTDEETVENGVVVDKTVGTTGNPISKTLYFHTEEMSGWTTVEKKKKKKTLLDDLYLADTGANAHIVYKTDMMQNLKNHVREIEVGGNRILKSTHIGDLALRAGKDGPVVGLQDVLVVPEFGRNIISIGAFTKRSAKFTMSKSVAMLEQGTRTLLMNQRNDGMYYLKAKRVSVAIPHRKYVFNTKVRLPALPVVSDEESDNEDDLDEDFDNSADEDQEMPKLDADKKKVRFESVENSGSGDEESDDDSESTDEEGIEQGGRKRKCNPPKETPKRRSIDINEAHLRFNHMGLGLLKKTLLYYRMPFHGKLKTCNGCMLAKARRVGIPKFDQHHATRAAERLQLDLSGPYAATTSGRNIG